MSKFGFLAAIMGLTAAMTIATGANAGQLNNQNLAAPGVYYGTGNVNGNFSTDTADGVELGLRATISGVANPVVEMGNTYHFTNLQQISLDYSANPDVGSKVVSLAGATSLITVKDLKTGVTASFDPSKVSDNDHNAAAPGGYQNSEKLSFSFLLGSDFGKFANDTYLVTDSLKLADDGGTLLVTNRDIVGTGAVPEPATWAMMLVGFGGLGVAMRTKRRQAIAAA
jgi:PEP-CTERM motif